MSRKVIVMGAGAAGLAAAWAARKGGSDVTLVHGRPGATAWYSGAADLRFWERPGAELLPIPDGAREYSRELGLWDLPEGGCLLATLAGMIRPARGRDRSLLDLKPLAGGRIGVPELGRQGWDAAGLCHALGGSSWAQSTGTRFEAITVAGLQKQHERQIPHFDLATLHDEEERILWLSQQLGRVDPGVDAWLFGPWLGVQSPAAQKLSDAAGKPVGETLHRVGDAAGERVSQAGAALLERMDIELLPGKAVELRALDAGWELTLGGRDPLAPLRADAVVLALGGVVSGGLELQPAPVGHVGGRAFKTSVAAELELELDGKDLDAASSLHGIDFETIGLEALERVGVPVVAAGQLSGRPGLFAAGALVAGRPRTVLEAVSSGVEAGTAAAAG